MFIHSLNKYLLSVNCQALCYSYRYNDETIRLHPCPCGAYGLTGSQWKSLSCVWLFVTLWTYSPWSSPGQNTGVGSRSLLQEIFPTQESNPGLLHCRWILYQLSHQGSPRILERIAYPVSRVTSRPRNRTAVSCIAGGFFTNWALREALT